jgi:acetyl esterase/lipase
LVLISGSAEILRNDSRALVERAQAAGVEAKLVELRDMVHCFYILTPYFPHEPALTEFQRFAQSRLG